MGSGTRSQRAPRGKSPRWRTGWRCRRAPLHWEPEVAVGGRGGPGPHLSRELPPSPQGPKAGVRGCPGHKEARERGPSRGPENQHSARPRPPRRTPLAVLARVARGADTVILVGLGVDACSPIGAGVVAATVVQVCGQGRGAQGEAHRLPSTLPEVSEPQAWLPAGPPPTATFVAQQAAPVGLAVALPGLHTAAMHAAGVRDALVAESPLPAVAAPGGVQGARGPVGGVDPRSCGCCQGDVRTQGVTWATAGAGILGL